ncbi:hypothetical protein SEA_MILDRED21_207 [Streptomyces phage Mildred21]|uniref:Lipoprotein n=1 Tax=Streptomyces phage Mildred21 TaxID=2023959 RepID=A0A222YWJ1_9CAUD|nr:hypothetical protein FDI35_gp109 [Streptomyces phage Mildred21]ASR75569.1 hypothetical protein SEA_MILDRED21_207 [Streptomyces phage Mildred21]
MNKNTLIPATIASAVVGALMLTGCSQEPSDGFKERCKEAEGTIERENDNTLGMSPVGFGVPKPPAPAKPAAPAPKAPAAPKPAQKAPKVEVPKTPKLPKNDAPKSDKTRTPRSTVTQTPNSNGLAFGKSKKRKSKKADDNDFLCVKDGELLFEEDE